MGQVGHSGHLYFHRNGYLPLYFLSALTGPLGDNGHVVICNIGICLNRQVAKSNHTPPGEQQDPAQHQPSTFEREINQGSNHYWLTEPSNSRALATTCCPGSMPEVISCLPPGRNLP